MAAIPPTTQARQQQARNQAITIILVQSCALAAIAQVFALSTFASAQVAEDALNNFLTWTDALLETIDAELQIGTQSDDSLDQLFMSVNQLATFVALDINTRASHLTKTFTYNSYVSLPALSLSQLIYQKASNDTVLVSLNDFPHPLFCAPSGLAVTP
jgi:prophage DNA circulation protein